MTRRYVTVREANEMLPMVRQSFFRIAQMQAHVHTAFDKLEALGSAPDTDHFEIAEEGLPTQAIPLRADLKGLVGALTDELDALEEHGCIVKDIEEGIFGWYAEDEEFGEIFLSWQLGEQKVLHWHEVNTGDIRRRSITELQNK